MRKLISADLQRILKKPGFWIFTVLAFALVDFITVKTLESGEDFTGLAFMFGANSNFELLGLFLNIILFSAIYCDDFRSMTFITVIGRGMTRGKLVIAKLLNSAILLVLLYVLNCIPLLVIGKVMCEPISSYETGLMLYAFVRNVLENLIFISMTSIFMYITEKVPVSIFVLLALQIGSTLLRSYATGLVREISIKLYFTEVFADSWTNFIFGAPVRAIFTMLFCFVCYIALCCGIIHFTFGKKELNF